MKIVSTFGHDSFPMAKFWLDAVFHLLLIILQESCVLLTHYLYLAKVTSTACKRTDVSKYHNSSSNTMTIWKDNLSHVAMW